MRVAVVQALQAKAGENRSSVLGEEVEIGLLPYIQAMLLARHLRGDLAEYPPFDEIGLGRRKWVGCFQTTSKPACTWEYKMLMLITIFRWKTRKDSKVTARGKIVFGLRRARTVFGVRMRHRARPVGCF